MYFPFLHKLFSTLKRLFSTMLSFDHVRMSQPPTSDHLPISSTPKHGGILQDGAQPKTEHHHIWLITGPAGSGKSTVAQFIAKSMNLPYIEGDEYHPQANIDKMAAGTPLTDADRWDWLTRLREESLTRLNQGSQGVVLTCSALKRKYRDVIRVAPYYSHDVLVHFVYLHAPQEVLIERVMGRKGHYMGANMVKSQFSALEPPGADETDVISVDVSAAVEVVEKEALDKIHAAIKAEIEADS